MFLFCNLLRAFYATMRGASPNRGLPVSVNPGISCPRKRVCRRKAAGNWCANNRACLFVPWHSRLVPRHWWLYLATRGGRRSAAYSAAPCAAANIAIFVRHFSFFASLPRLLKPTFYLVLKQGKKVQQFIYIYICMCECVYNIQNLNLKCNPHFLNTLVVLKKQKGSDFFFFFLFSWPLDVENFLDSGSP